MTVSVRLDTMLEERLRELAQTEGVPISEVVRRAIIRYYEERADDCLERRLADVVGKVRSADGGRASRTGASFKELLQSGG